MKKKLFRQMLNEWQSNLWIVIEFIIVSVVLWFICDYFSSAYCIYNNPRGFDSSHCYLLDLYEITDKSPEYVEGRTEEQMIEDKLEILERLKRRPEVEAASYFEQFLSLQRLQQRHHLEVRLYNGRRAETTRNSRFRESVPLQGHQRREPGAARQRA